MRQEDDFAHSSGTYAKVMLSADHAQIVKTITDLINVENAVSPFDLHTTVVFSRTSCKTIKEYSPRLPIKAHGIGFEIFDNNDGTKSLVMLLDSQELHTMHNTFRNYHGASHDFPTYLPHLTLSYDYRQENTPEPSILPYFNDLTFDAFVVEPLSFSWVPATDDK